MKLFCVVTAAILALTGSPGFAQSSYPDRPIKLIIPFVPGGVVDVVGRTLASRLEAQMGQPVVVENRAGAANQVGTTVVTNAAPDGYTLLVVDPSVVTTPTLQANAPYQLGQLRTIATLSTAPLIVVVNPSLPVNNLKELIEFSKKTPEGVTYASAGVGTTPHLAPELLKVQSGFNATHIPYKGGAASLTDLVSGRVQTAFYSGATVLPNIIEGKLRAIAQTGTHRMAARPDIPTGVESGYPDFVVQLWTALFTPSGVPADVQKRLEKEVRQAVESKEFLSVIEKFGLESFYKSQPDAERFVQSESDRWSALIKAAKITIQ